MIILLFRLKLIKFFLIKLLHLFDILSIKKWTNHKKSIYNDTRCTSVL